MILRAIALTLLFAACLLPAGSPACEDKPEKVKVTLVVILAGEDGNKVDNSLKWVAAEVQKKEPKLTNFRVKTMVSRSLTPLEKSSFELVDDAKAIITVKSSADADNKVVLTVTAPNQGEIEYRSACGKFLPIVTRYQTKAKERLILAVRVQPCQGN